MIIWLNGPFGGGKTTTARAVVNRHPEYVAFDTEQVGVMLRHVLDDWRPVDDFQDWPPWRTLVVASLVEISRYLDADLVVPQSVLHRDYWKEIAQGLRANGVEVKMITLTADFDELRRRIAADERDPLARGWREIKLETFWSARAWLAQYSTMIDTTGRSPEDVAAEITS